MCVHGGDNPVAPVRERVERMAESHVGTALLGHLEKHPLDQFLRAGHPAGWAH